MDAEFQCTNCEGSGYFDMPDGREVACSVCHGKAAYSPQEITRMEAAAAELRAEVGRLQAQVRERDEALGRVWQWLAQANAGRQRAGESLSDISQRCEIFLRTFIQQSSAEPECARAFENLSSWASGAMVKQEADIARLRAQVETLIEVLKRTRIALHLARGYVAKGDEQNVFDGCGLSGETVLHRIDAVLDSNVPAA